MAIYRHKRGNIATLPASGEVGELIIANDVGELYGGQGTGTALLRFSLKRYTVGIKSFVLATGYGVELIKNANSCGFNIPTGVEIVSASIHFDSSEIGTNTNCFISLPNVSYDDLYIPQFQVLADVENSRAYKTGIAGNLNASANILELTALKEFQSIWVRITL